MADNEKPIAVVYAPGARRPDEPIKTQTELELERVQAQLVELQARAAAEAAVAAEYGEDEKALALWLHDQFCPYCVTGVGCPVGVAKRQSVVTGQPLEWASPVMQGWLKKVNNLIDAAPSLGWIITAS